MNIAILLSIACSVEGLQEHQRPRLPVAPDPVERLERFHRLTRHAVDRGGVSIVAQESPPIRASALARPRRRHLPGAPVERGADRVVVEAVVNLHRFHAPGIAPMTIMTMPTTADNTPPKNRTEPSASKITTRSSSE